MPVNDNAVDPDVDSPEVVWKWCVILLRQGKQNLLEFYNGHRDFIGQGFRVGSDILYVGDNGYDWIRGQETQNYTWKYINVDHH